MDKRWWTSDGGQAMESLGPGVRGGTFIINNFICTIMDRDEAIARGLEIHETKHSMKRRSPWHDYHGRGTYMLTLVVEGRIPLLGKLVGRVNARPGDGDGPKVMLSELGTAIVKEEIPKIHKYYPPGGGVEDLHHARSYSRDCEGEGGLERRTSDGIAWNGGERGTWRCSDLGDGRCSCSGEGGKPGNGEGEGSSSD